MTERDPYIFSEAERHGMEQRIVHDACLVQGGAKIGELGRLVLTEYQVEVLYNSGGEQDPVDTWLATDVEDAWRAYAPRAAVRIPYVLKRGGLNNVRDVLAAGRERVRDLRNAGQGTIDGVGGMLQNEFGIAWSEKPAVAEIRAICNDLSQVNAIVLDAPIKRGYTVQQVLDTPSNQRKDLVEFTWPQQLTAAELHEWTDHIYESAVAFAERFQGPADPELPR